MPRKLRIEYPGAIYHVMNRGDRREDIFRDDEDRQRFLFTPGEACGKTERQVHAYCLRRNHGGNYGAQRQETSVQKAERIVQEAVEGLGWNEDELRARHKRHRAKVMLARRLREQTTMSLKWIAQRLHMGSWTYVSNLLNEPPPTQPQGQEVLLLCQ